MSIITLYRSLTNDYRVYHYLRPDLYVEGEDQYAAIGELIRRHPMGEVSHGRSYQDYELSSFSSQDRRSAFVLGLRSRQEWRDRSEMLRQTSLDLAGESIQGQSEAVAV